MPSKPFSKPIVAGRAGLVEMPIQMIWHRINGQEYERRWWGPADAVRMLYLSARAGAISVEFTQSPGSAIGILSARYSGVIAGDEIPLETLEIDFTDQSPPLHYNPSFIAISAADILSMEQSIQSHSANTQTAGTAKYSYYELRSKGVDSYRAKLPFLTWTRTVGINYSRDLDLANVGAIFTTEDLASNIGAPILYEIPTGNVGVADSDNFTTGWLKGARAGLSSDGRVQLVITAEFGCWANDAYIFA